MLSFIEATVLVILLLLLYSVNLKLRILHSVILCIDFSYAALILFVKSSLNSSSARNVVFVKRCYCSCHYSIAVFTYSRKYLCRRIPHASNGSFNPYVITNKHAHIINANIFSTDKKDIESRCARISTEAHAASSTTPQFTTVPRHFINYYFKHPGKFSCAVDCFLELSCLIFVDSLRNINRNPFF